MQAFTSYHLRFHQNPPQVPLDSLPLPSAMPLLDVLKLGDDGQIAANSIGFDDDFRKNMQRSLAPSYFKQFDVGGVELWKPETTVC